MRNFLEKGTSILFRRQTNILSAAFVLMVAVGLSSLLGIARDRLLYARFYSCCSQDLDAYLAAFRLPDMVFQLVVLGAVSSAFIPVFSQLLQKDKKEAHSTASSVVTIISFIFLNIGAVIFLFARPLSELITASFNPHQINLMVDLTRIMLLAQFFFLLSNFTTAIIQTHDRFLLPALSPLIYNLSIIVGIVAFSEKLGVFGPAVGVVIGAFLHLLIQIPLAVKLGFKFRPSLNLKLPGVLSIGRLMLPRSLTLAVSQIELTVSVFLATSLAPGSLAIFNLAQNLMTLPVRLIGTTIGQATLPSLSRDFTKSDLAEFKTILINSLHQVMFLVFPASTLLLVLRVQVVRLAFGAKTFPWQATLLTGRVLMFFFLAIVTQAATQILVRAFYATHDTKTPFLASSISIFTNISLAIFLTFHLGWGVIGLAAANSVGSLVQTLLLIISLDRKLKRFNRKDLFAPLLKMSLSAFLCAIFLWVPMRFLDKYFDTTRTINLIILTILAGATGLLVYIFFSRLLKIQELRSYFGLVKRIGKWREVLSESDEVIESASR